MKTWAILLVLLLTGCAAAPRAPDPEAAGLFRDAAFDAPSEPVDASGLFTLSPEMRAYLKSPAFIAQLRDKGRARGLVAALYARGELKLEYDSSMTRTAAQTYAARAGNCLSLVIMTAAFARELGMTVRFQNVDVDESWSRSGSTYLISGHVNLGLGQRSEALTGYDPERVLIVDFLPPQDASRLRTRPLEEEDIVAYYMNNRAAEALVQGRVDDAYWWARAAVARHASDTIAFNTLGVVYQRKGDMAQAERVFRAVLERDPENLVVMQNLAPVLAANGKASEARQLNERIARLEPNPPFHFFDQGMQAMAGGDYKKARELFAREVKRAPYYDEFHFWLAIACLHLGDARAAREQMALALDTSTRRDSRDRYSAKLAHLRSLESGRTSAR
jgi:tetratricopeptide (TPR) repeat protein